MSDLIDIDDDAIERTLTEQADEIERLTADNEKLRNLKDQKNSESFDLHERISELQARVEELELIVDAAKEWWNAPNRLAEDASLGKLAALIEAATEQGESDENTERD